MLLSQCLSKGEPAHRAEWVNTDAPEFHLGPPVTKSPSSLMSFSSPSYFPANHCCFACVPCFLFLLHFLQFPSLPLPKSCWACPFEVLPPAYFLSHPSTLSSHVLPFSPAFPYPILPFVPVLPMLFPHLLSLSKSSWACPPRVPLPAYFLPFSFTLPCNCGFYLFCICIFFFPFSYWNFP